MTYFAFLGVFLVIPLIILAGLTWRDQRHGLCLPESLRGAPFWLVLAGHVLVALIYTTPWDNYLVATGVWWYNPDLVTGITLGWVPIEEYTFFVLQTLVTGLWLLWWAKRLPDPPTRDVWPHLRWAASLAVAILWVGSVAILVAGWHPGIYLGLILVWALPPVILQLAFGADILWRYRRLLLVALLPVVFYLAAADFLAIGSGTWTIDPAQSLEIYLGGVLPLEEFVFFLMTNVLIVLGTTLVLARASFERVAELRARLRRSWAS